jgi:hypothetical protein
MGTIVDKDELERLIREAAARHPARVNPRAADGSCLWWEILQCLLAFVLVNRLGFTYNADWEGREPFRLFLDLGFDVEAALVAFRYQDDPQVSVVTWGMVLDRNSAAVSVA